jgi:hypothetical protein
VCEKSAQGTFCAVDRPRPSHFSMSSSTASALWFVVVWLCVVALCLRESSHSSIFRHFFLTISAASGCMGVVSGVGAKTIQSPLVWAPISDQQSSIHRALAFLRSDRADLDPRRSIDVHWPFCVRSGFSRAAPRQKKRSRGPFLKCSMLSLRRFCSLPLGEC